MFTNIGGLTHPKPSIAETPYDPDIIGPSIPPYCYIPCDENGKKMKPWVSASPYEVTICDYISFYCRGSWKIEIWRQICREVNKKRRFYQVKKKWYAYHRAYVERRKVLIGKQDVRFNDYLEDKFEIENTLIKLEAKLEENELKILEIKRDNGLNLENNNDNEYKNDIIGERNYRMQVEQLQDKVAAQNRKILMLEKNLQQQGYRNDNYYNSVVANDEQAQSKQQYQQQQQHQHQHKWRNNNYNDYNHQNGDHYQQQQQHQHQHKWCNNNYNDCNNRNGDYHQQQQHQQQQQEQQQQQQQQIQQQQEDEQQYVEEQQQQQNGDARDVLIRELCKLLLHNQK